MKRNILFLCAICLIIISGVSAIVGYPPAASFVANETAVCTYDIIQFNDTSTNEPTAWKWAFGDGTTSALQNLTHSYNLPGLYTVSLKVGNVYGTDVIIKDHYINVTDCNPQLTWCDRQTLFFQHAGSSDLPGYEQLINYPSGAAEVDESVTVKNTLGYVLIDKYISPLGSPNANQLLNGLRRFRTYHYVSTASGITKVNYTFFKRSASGIETSLYSVETADINDLAVTEQLTSYASSIPYTLAHDDRVGVKMYGISDHSSNVVLHFVYEGSTHNSHLESGYYVCDVVSPVLPSDGGSSGGEATGAVFGLIGGLIAALICCRRKKE